MNLKGNKWNENCFIAMSNTSSSIVYQDPKRTLKVD